MKPAQVLDLQADLMVRLQATLWREAMREQLALDMNRHPNNRAAKYSEQVVDRLHDEIQAAAAYYVDPKMTPLVEWASAGLDDTDKIRMDELPTERGFAYFENPLVLRDIHGIDLLINAVLWFRVEVQYYSEGKATPGLHPGVMVAAFNDAQVTPDEISATIANSGYTMGNGRWHLIGTQFIGDEMRLGPSTLPPSHDDEAEYSGEELKPFTNIVRLLHAYWLLLGQTVTSVEEGEVPRAFAKRARKMQIPERVTVISLRRVEGHSHGETDVEWQHRWMVRGHWAWRKCSAHHELAEPDPKGGWHARVWIRAHIKGPEGKPFHYTEKVYALVR